MRFRMLLSLLVFTAGSLLLPHFVHAAIPFLGPIIPPPRVSGIPGSDVCAAGWGMLIIVINNIIQLLITLAIVFVAPLMIAYAGFLYVVNPISSETRTKANKVLTNTIVGIVIALAAWMIVDALMAVLYNKTAAVPGTRTTLGTWSQLVVGNASDLCIPLAGSLKPAAPPPPTVAVAPAGLVTITTFSCKNPSSCQVPTSVNTKLNQMKSNLEAAGHSASEYWITETGVNTTVTHASGSNNLDMSCRGQCSPAQVKAAIAAWPGSVKYETSSQADYDAMIAAGVPSGNILGPSWFTGTFNSGGTCSTGTGHCITAPHMSLN